MQALVEGDLTGLAELYRRHMANVHALCYRLTGSAEAADDMVQETFLRVVRHRASFRGQARFTTWLYRIARNVCIDHLQSSQRRRRARERYRVVTGNAGHVQAPEPPEDVRALARALARLSHEKREALVLSRYYDLSHTEIADIVGCSVGAVKVRVHRALKDLRGMVEVMERESDEVSGERRAHP
jgi:RNA polymerase sigma-70 factor (ECF subfamily)